MSKKSISLLGDSKILTEALLASFTKLDPRTQVRNPVMFVVFVGSILTTIIGVQSLATTTAESPWFILGVPSGFGSRCFSRTLRKRLPKGTEKPRRTRLRRSRPAGPGPQNLCPREDVDCGNAG